MDLVLVALLDIALHETVKTFFLALDKILRGLLFQVHVLPKNIPVFVLGLAQFLFEDLLVEFLQLLQFLLLVLWVVAPSKREFAEW